MDLTPWKQAQENAPEIPEKRTEVSVLTEQKSVNSIVALTSFLSALTESQWKEMQETVVKHQQYQHLQPMPTLSKTLENDFSFETERNLWLEHITKDQGAATELMELIRENGTIHGIFQNILEKAEANAEAAYKIPVMTQISVHMTEMQKKSADNMVIQRMSSWLHSIEADGDTFSNQEKNNVLQEDTAAIQRQTVLRNLMDAVQKNDVFPKSADSLKQMGRMATNRMQKGELSQKIHLFSGVMNQETAESAFLQPDAYGIAQMVVVKKSQGNAMVQTPPKIPEVILEAKKAMQTEVHDIITKRRSQEPEQADSKTVLELIRRLDAQQKEIEKIRSTQKQILNITDISVVTEKIMNHMQSQLRLEKMRRGL